MVRDQRWKFVWWQGLRPQLFDLGDDPCEFSDRGEDAGCEPVRRRMQDQLLHWLQERKLRTTVDDAWVEGRTNTHRKHGIHYGVW